MEIVSGFGHYGYNDFFTIFWTLKIVDFLGGAVNIEYGNIKNGSIEKILT